MIDGEVFLIRHSHDDHSYIDGENNTSLTRKGIEDARLMGARMARILHERDERTVNIHTSSKKRSVETAEILSEELDRNYIHHGLQVDNRLRELYQGKIIDFRKLAHQRKADLLQLSWEVFDERRVSGDLSYHFGDFQAGGEVKEPLRGFIEFPYGESQNDFSFRTADALRDIVINMRDEESLPLIVAHRGGIREIRNLIFAINHNLPICQAEEREQSGLKYCEIIPDHITDIGFCIQALDGHLKSIKTAS